MEMEQVLLSKYGPLLTLCQLAELLDRSPQGITNLTKQQHSPLAVFET